MARPQQYPVCPQCRKNLTRRSKRQGVVEHALSLLYVYPFRCQLCALRFRALQWGARFERYTPDRREYIRVPVEVPATFSGEHVRGQGTVVNLSMRGCALAAPVQPNPGEVVCLQLDRLNGSPQITIDAAVVRSLAHQEIGFEMLRVHDHEREKLQQVIESLLDGSKKERGN